MNEPDDLWLDGVRRWYYGGSLPDGEAKDSDTPAVPHTRAEPLPTAVDRPDGPASRAGVDPPH